MNAGGYVETQGARLYYQDWGAGEPVLLLHGNAQSHRVFRWYLRHCPSCSISCGRFT